MTQTRKDLIVIKAFGKAAEHKLKGLLNLTPTEAAELPQKTVSQVNRIAKELNVPDYTLLDFGKGAGTLIAFVQDIIATQYRGCDLIVDLDSREAPILSAALAARAVNVIRRF